MIINIIRHSDKNKKNGKNWRHDKNKGRKRKTTPSHHLRAPQYQTLQTSLMLGPL